MNTDDYLKQPQLNVTLQDIHEPPCKECQYFSPRAITDHVGNLAGFVLCTAKQQHRDFSCFEEQEKLQ